MIYSMPIPTNRPLPKASPRSCDTSLLKSLIRDRAACVAWSRAIESRCRAIQFRYQRGYWQSDRELRQMQRQATAVIRAAHVYRDLDRDVILVIDALQAFVAGIDMNRNATVAA